MNIQNINLTNLNVSDASISTKNCLVYLDANDPASYPGTGTTVYNLIPGYSSNWNHILTSNASFTIYEGVKCFACTQGLARLEVSGGQTSGPYLPTTGFTYIIWMLYYADARYYRILIDTYRDIFPTSPACFVPKGGQSYDIGGLSYNSDSFYSSGFNISAGPGAVAFRWAQYAIVDKKYYINGKFVGERSGTNSDQSYHLSVGGSFRSLGPSNPYPRSHVGYIANMFLYNVALTEEQINQNYYALKSRFGII